MLVVSMQIWIKKPFRQGTNNNYFKQLHTNARPFFVMKPFYDVLTNNRVRESYTPRLIF